MQTEIALYPSAGGGPEIVTEQIAKQRLGVHGPMPALPIEIGETIVRAVVRNSVVADQFHSVSVSAELVGDDHVITETLVARPLAEVKAEALRIVDEAAELARLQFITPGAGQALVYERKREEAEAYLAELTPDPADYPLLKSRAERLDPLEPDYDAVAADWSARAVGWIAAAAVIEELREAAKEDIPLAGNASEVATLIDITWPSPA